MTLHASCSDIQCVYMHVRIVLVFSVVRGVTHSDLRMVTGFGPFNLPTCDQLQRGRDHSQIGVRHLWMLYSCVTHVTHAYTGLCNDMLFTCFVNKCYKAYESLETRYRVIFTLVVGDVGGGFCVVVVVDADRLVVNCA